MGGVSTLPHHLVGPLPSHFYINSGTLQHVPPSIRPSPPSELSQIAATTTTTTTIPQPIPITSSNVTSVTTSQVNMTEGHPNEKQQQQQMFSNNSGSNSISDRQQMQYFYG